LELAAWSFSEAWMLVLGDFFSSVRFSHHEIKRAQNHGHVADHRARHQFAEDAQIDE
jgi:hypothetical protein